MTLARCTSALLLALACACSVDAGDPGSSDGAATDGTPVGITPVDDCAACPVGTTCVEFGPQRICIPDPATEVPDCEQCPADQVCRLVGNQRFCSDAPPSCGDTPTCACLGESFCDPCAACSQAGAMFECAFDCVACPDQCGGET